MSGKGYCEIAAALAADDRDRAAALATELLRTGDTTALRARLANTVLQAGGTCDIEVILEGFGHPGVLADALVAYGLRAGILVAPASAVGGRMRRARGAPRALHLLRLAHDADHAALGRRLSALSPATVLLVADPDVEVPPLLAHWPTLSASRLGVTDLSNWIDPRQLGEERAMLTPHAARLVAGAATTWFKGRHWAPDAPPLKLIITDFDDTLWGGVLGEDGPDGLDMGAGDGRNFAGYQAALSRLADCGVLLAGVSRNRPEDVEAVFAEHRAIGVRRSQFIAIHASWRAKAESIRDLLARTQVAAEAAVFIDNDPVERGQVSADLPGLLVPDDGDWPSDCIARLEAEGRFGLTGTEEDAIRTRSTKASLGFAEALRTGASRQELLASLGMRITFEPVDAGTAARAHQIASRVTQFRTAATPADWEAGGYHSFLLRLEETGVDHGRVGLVIWHTEKECAVIDLLCLSCRALSRDLDSALLAETARQADHAGLGHLLGRVEVLPRNTPARDVYLRHGFDPSGPGLFRHGNFGIEMPSHFSVRSDAAATR